MAMKIIYRISDKGNPKMKPYYATKKGCFLHFLNRFKEHDIYVIADNVCDATHDFLISLVDPTKVFRTQLNNAGAFLHSVEFAIARFADDDKIYLAEDDYIYTKDAAKVIEEGFQIAPYVSGYDHPDKYLNHSEGGPNPFIHGGGEATRAVMTQSRHWKFTNSCCMTFATTVKTLKEDLHIYKKHCATVTPNDFGMFCELILPPNGTRRLVSPMPAVSTHAETEWLAKFVNWENEFHESIKP